MTTKMICAGWSLAVVLLAHPHVVLDAKQTARPTYVAGKGSLYRKLATNFGNYVGIKGVLVLPLPRLDPRRVTPSGKPLDGFSIYMGGNARGKQEVDAGLMWAHCPEKNPQAYCWRPFVRTNHPFPNDTSVYWNTGEAVVMSVRIVHDGVLRLWIRDANTSVGRPKRNYWRDFRAPLFRSANRIQFKRVNSIDQVGQEGQSVLPTASAMTGAIWRDTYVLMPTSTYTIFALPLTRVEHMDVREFRQNVHTSQNAAQAARGGESIDVSGTLSLILSDKTR